MKKTLTRLLCLALCLVTLISLLPVTASAASFGTPKNLKWNKYYVNGALQTQYGSVSFQAADPTDLEDEWIWFDIYLYRDGEYVTNVMTGWHVSCIPEYFSFDLSPFIEKSGTYHFTVHQTTQDGLTTSAVKKSGNWTYTKPSSRLTKPTNLAWDFPTMTWSGTAPFELECYFSPTKPENGISDMQWFHHQWGIPGNSNEPPYGYFGPGYYVFRVRRTSTDITEKAHSYWATSDVYRFKMDTPVASGSNVASTGYPKITWDAVDYAVEYQIYRSTSKTGSYTKVGTTDGTSFTDKTAVAGKCYYYKVRGVSEFDVKSSYSNVVQRTCDLPRPAVKTSNVASSGKIKVTWNKVDGAAKYEIYRSTSKNGEYKLMWTTTSTSYTNTSAKVGTTYYYKVKAIHEKSAANSALSTAVNRTCDLPRPDVSISLTAKGKPSLTWDAVSGATEYEIYRATSKNGEYTKIKTVEKTSFNNTGATAGKTYYYKVKAIYGSKTAANSAYSTVVSITAK